MKFLLLVIITLPLCSNAQTKEETKEWIEYYLNRYQSKPKVYSETKEYSQQQFYFKTDTLVVHYYTYKRMGDNSNDVLIKSEYEYIDLSTIKTIEVTQDSLTLTNQSVMDIFLRFNGDNSSSYNYRKEDWINPKENKKWWTSFYQIKIFGDKLYLDNFTNRMKKALEHLASTLGAKLLKEAF